MMERTKVYYLAGPISGKDNFNIAAFEEATWTLREQGWTIVQPFEINGLQHRRGITETPEERIEYFRNDLRALIECYGIIMLPDWQDSVGASLEHRIACALNMDIRYLSATDKGLVL